MKKNSITEFELERQDSKIRLKRGLNGGSAGAQPEDYIQPNYGSLPPAGASAGHPPQSAPPIATGEIDVKSPMIGTFYRAPSPEAGHYIEIGMEVTPETVVCIIEAMKVMNPIRAPRDGKILEICVADAKPVEFGEPLIILE